MRVLIVDDEPAARRRLSLMLEELDVEVVGEAANGLEALDLVQHRTPDVLLLDIAMPEVDGLDVARRLPDHGPLVIFQTAYDEYALEAFEHAAVDYLVKPVELTRLELALGRARDRLQADRSFTLTADVIEGLRESLTLPRRQPRILVRDRGGHRLVPWEDVLRFTTEAGAVFATTAAGRFLTDYTLAELEARTVGSFVRASRGDLVNASQVVRITGAGDGAGELELADGTTVRISRRRMADVRSALGS